MTDNHASPQFVANATASNSTELDNEVFLAELSSRLETKLAARISPSARAEILRDISSLLAGGTPLESFGTPEELAEQISASISDLDDTNPELHFDLPGHYSISDSTWNLQDPRIFVPRRIGSGWDINVGALAVKTGFLRPDDVDDEVLDAIPHSLVTALQWTPAIAAAINGALVVAGTRRGKRQILSTTLRGRVKRYWPLRFGAVVAADGPAVIAGFVLAGTNDKREQISRMAMANSLGVAFVANSYASLATTDNKTPRGVLALGSLATLLVDMQLPIVLVRIGRSRVTRKPR